MPGKKAHRHLQPGDHVSIPGENLSGVVAETLPHDVIVKVIVNGEVQHRRYSIEFVMREPASDEISDCVDR
ncbi:MAG: hypothetical protein ACXWC5_28725 [Burkholderiales bacterium]